MKKIFAVLFLISFLTVLIAPTIASAQVSSKCTMRYSVTIEKAVGAAPEKKCNSGSVYEEGAAGDLGELFGICCLLNTIYRVADLFFAVLIVFSVLMILIAAYTFITAGGAPEKVNKARDYILYALVGLIVAFLARAIPGIVKLLLT